MDLKIYNKNIENKILDYTYLCVAFVSRNSFLIFERQAI